MGKYKNLSQAQDLRGRNITYEKPADVQPAYYRVSDNSGGARMESGSDYKGNEPVIDPGCVCGNCNGVVTITQKFCGHCGATLG